jgi:uncharacterized protein DUF3830
MARTIILRFVDEEVSAVADLLEDQAPETCRMIWEHLPLEGRTVHGMYSGPELFIRADHLPQVSPENQVHRALPGDVGFWYQEGGRYHSAPAAAAAEVVFIYQRGAAIMGPDGQPTWVNLFAQIRTDDAGAFYETARKVRTEGPQVLRIERG